ncbi:Type 1 glutamine amidotransferase-like domain-containing protein [Paraflavitalea pollutisoli]|uniref:Type 1 glutamine amidotransferase-like domain-containing protein n=1 Tax=Paraflavitalea pollutisoli TaxID=3034143 RepID=UPI0023EB319F|nr:Type 1 glutamine amidotransferase-like domain-containing protein [Paraflavitalea sp. H1-2-19X]
MKLLLTSAGISNERIHQALVDLLGKPVSEASALFVPTAIYAIPNGGNIVQRVINGTLGDPFCQLGWKTWGLLELTALPGLKHDLWVPLLEETDALLVGGGDCQFLTYWMQQSGLADMLPALLQKTVYVGLSAGSMIMTSYGTTYGHHDLPADTPRSLGFLDFALHPHLDYPAFPDNSLANLSALAQRLPMPSYAIDDQTAIQVVDGVVEVVSKGHWKLFTPGEGIS